MMQIDNETLNNQLERCRETVDNKLAEYFEGEYPYMELLESMRYSLLAGGKRIRAILCLKFCEAAGGDAAIALDAACAIEMLHTYSLIHDDLPCMDDDDVRRGKPSNHIEYGEFTATLAGDALQAAAFETLLKSGLPSDSVLQMGLILAEAAGPYGICGGQFLDMVWEGMQLSEDELVQINSLKTASLIAACAKIGVIAAGGTDEQISAAEEYALAVGYAFQMRDDVLDYTSTEEELGKPVLSDMKRAKTTYASLLGIDECERIINDQTLKAIAALDGEFEEPSFLIWLAQTLADRKS